MLNSKCRVTARHVRLGGLLLATLGSVTVFEGATAQQVKVAEVARAIGELRRLSNALVKDAELSTPQRMICKTCFPAPISHWRAENFYSLGGDRTNQAQNFLRDMRTVLTAATCDGNSDALDEIDKLSKQAEGVVLTEAEAIVLDYQSNRVGLQSGFRTRSRQKTKQAIDTSQNAKEISAVTAALRAADISGALRQLPSLNELCKM